MKTNEFLKMMYKGCDSGFLTITTLPNAKTVWFKISDPESPAQIEKAARYAENSGKHTNVFFGTGLRRNILKNGMRGGENDISCVTALYADIDIKGSAHAQINLPKTLDEAVNFLNSLSLKPSIIVNSGNGVHAYWLLDKPYIISDSQSKERIVTLFRGFGKYINEEAKKHGWKIDNVSDLARILRLPGTFNHKLKSKTMCEVIENNENGYKLDDFYKILETSCPRNTNIKSSEPTNNIESMIKKCAFIKHCRDNAATLPEPLWHAMITNMAPLKNGYSTVHEFSRPYAGYSKEETDEKIQHALREDKPHTCAYIKDALNFDCGTGKSGPGCCNVKAPIVFGLPSNEERIKELLSNKIDVSKIFTKENMKLCAWAKINSPAEYSALKLSLKGKVGLKDFERAVQHQLKSKAAKSDFAGKSTLNLSGIDLKGAVVPKGWNISLEKGIQRSYDEEVQEVCPCVLVISKRFENIDDSTQKVEISFFRDGHWQSVIASRSHVFNRASIIKFADSGLPVSSGNATEVVKFLCDYENANLNVIPLIRSISRMGWVGKEFFPHCTKSEVQFETEYKEATNIVGSTEESGNFEIWKDHALKLRDNVFGRFLLSGSFASPLLSLLGNRVFFIHIWHDSKSGKTAAIKTAVSVWGNPSKLMGSFNATAVGLERMAAILKHLPFALDELQVLNSRRQTVENIIYSLGNGYGRLRGAREGAVQETLSWHNIILTSGEQPMSKESSNDGILTRALELYGKPCEDVNFAHDLHLMSVSNYGFAGKKYTEFVINSVFSQKGKIKKDFEMIRKGIEKQNIENKDTAHIDNIAVVCLGDYYSSISVFGIDEKTAKDEAIILGLEILKNTKDFVKADTTDRAWDFVIGWIASNKNRFLPDSTPCFGKIENDSVYIIPNILRDALEENGFDYSKVTRGFKERGFLKTQNDAKGISRMHVQKWINGINQKCFCIQGVMICDSDASANPLK